MQHSRARGISAPDEPLAHVAPLGWEHIALIGDYVWSGVQPETAFWPLRDVRFTTVHGRSGSASPAVLVPGGPRQGLNGLALLAYRHAGAQT